MHTYQLRAQGLSSLQRFKGAQIQQRQVFIAPKQQILLQILNAHKKGQGSVSNDKNEQNPKYRGVKVGDGEIVRIGSVIIRQVGDKTNKKLVRNGFEKSPQTQLQVKIKPGKNVGKGKDYTLYAKIPGIVKFIERRGQKEAQVFPVDHPFVNRDLIPTRSLFPDLQNPPQNPTRWQQRRLKYRPRALVREIVDKRNKKTSKILLETSKKTEIVNP